MKLVRSLLRIAIAVAVIAAIGLAALWLVLRQPDWKSLPFRGTIRTQPERLKQHVVYLTETVHPRNADHPANLQHAADYIAQRFRDARGRTSLQTFTARGNLYANVVARWGPDDPSIPVLVIGAHYDAFGDLPGADDNASGTAGLLELARLLGVHRIPSPVMLVAYSTEEPPFFGSEQMGSAVHAQSLAAERVPVHGMINLEMIGYFAGRQTWPNALFEWFYPDQGDFIGVVGGWQDRELARFVKRAIAGAGGVPVVSFTGPRETSDASDHRNYWSHGWRAVVVTDTAFLRNPNYHTARDTAGTLDYERMARVVDGVFNAALTFDAVPRPYGRALTRLPRRTGDSHAAKRLIHALMRGFSAPLPSRVASDAVNPHFAVVQHHHPPASGTYFPQEAQGSVQLNSFSHPLHLPETRTQPSGAHGRQEELSVRGMR
jgi:Peptidase family M28